MWIWGWKWEWEQFCFLLLQWVGKLSVHPAFLFHQIKWAKEDQITKLVCFDNRHFLVDKSCYAPAFISFHNCKKTTKEKRTSIWITLRLSVCTFAKMFFVIMFFVSFSAENSCPHMFFAQRISYQIISAVFVQYGFMRLERSLKIHPCFSLANLSLLMNILTKRYIWIAIIEFINLMEKIVEWFCCISWCD
jgi:hypothetical protein